MSNVKIKSIPKLKIFFIGLSIFGLSTILLASIELNHQRNPIEVIEFYDNPTPIILNKNPKIEELNFEEIEERLKRQSSLLSVIYEFKPTQNENFGTMIIPKLDRTLSILQGTDEKQLANGIGHVLTSVLPGENDNSVVAGHRETSFRNLDDLSIGDTVKIQTALGEFIYKITHKRVVDADDETVIISNKYASLTLVTCYPFDWVGSAPQRYIVSLILVDRILY